MARIFRKSYVVSVPAKAKMHRKDDELLATWFGPNGKEITAVVETRPDGTNVIRKWRKTWVARFRDASGIVRERSTGCTNKSAAKLRLAEFVKEQERIAAGVITAEEAEIGKWNQTCLKDAIDDYEAYLQGRGVRDKRVRFTKSYLLEGTRECNWKSLSDLNSDRLQRYLDRLHENGNSAPLP